MRITKRQLKRIIKEEKAKILAEEKVRKIVREKLAESYGVTSPKRRKLVEFFGLFGGGSDKTVKMLNDVVNDMGDLEAEVRNSVAAGKEPEAAKARKSLLAATADYIASLEKAKDGDYEAHYNHDTVQKVRTNNEFMNAFFQSGADNREGAIAAAKKIHDEFKQKMG